MCLKTVSIQLLQSSISSQNPNAQTEHSWNSNPFEEIPRLFCCVMSPLRTSKSSLLTALVKLLTFKQCIETYLSF